MAPPKRNPWDRQPGEPAAAYARFLAYRNLGPGRSLDRAYQSFAAEGEERRRVPGLWSRDCTRWRWVQRATEWDIHVLTDQARETVTCYVEVIKRAAGHALAALIDPEMKPTTWGQILETVDILGRVIPPEAIQAVARGGDPAR